MLTGVYEPAPGCWEVTGDYGETSSALSGGLNRSSRPSVKIWQFRHELHGKCGFMASRRPVEVGGGGR
jgi:hypothetical protein